MSFDPQHIYNTRYSYSSLNGQIIQKKYIKPGEVFKKTIKEVSEDADMLGYVIIPKSALFPTTNSWSDTQSYTCSGITSDTSQEFTVRQLATILDWSNFFSHEPFNPKDFTFKVSIKIYSFSLINSAPADYDNYSLIVLDSASYSATMYRNNGVISLFNYNDFNLFKQVSANDGSTTGGNPSDYNSETKPHLSQGCILQYNINSDYNGYLDIKNGQWPQDVLIEYVRTVPSGRFILTYSITCSISYNSIWWLPPGSVLPETN